MAVFRQVLQNTSTKKWAYCEFSDESNNPPFVIGAKEFDTEAQANDWRDQYLTSEKETEAERERNIKTFNFGLALELLKSGHRVARKGWNGKGMWLGLVKSLHYQVEGLNLPINHSAPDGNVQNLLPWIGMKTADNMFVPWLASQTDVLADDWTSCDAIGEIMVSGDPLEAARNVDFNSIAQMSSEALQNEHQPVGENKSWMEDTTENERERYVQNGENEMLDLHGYNGNSLAGQTEVLDDLRSDTISHDENDDYKNYNNNASDSTSGNNGAEEN